MKIRRLDENDVFFFTFISRPTVYTIIIINVYRFYTTRLYREQSSCADSEDRRRSVDTSGVYHDMTHRAAAAALTTWTTGAGPHVFSVRARAALARRGGPVDGNHGPDE